ncbi:MAG: hypothetical protein RL220_1883, partial [Bacteroidota bacterium]
MSDNPHSSDAYSPPEIAHKVESLGVTKANAPAYRLFILAVLAGAFISLGALFFAVTIADSNLGYGITRLIGGMSFCLGLILVVVAGAELFTGNNLLAMAWASRLISTRSLLRNWVIVYAGNAAGCVLTVMACYAAGIHHSGNNAVGETLSGIALSKTTLSGEVIFIRAIMCNALVCLAVWLTLGGHSVTDKVLAILFPITAFVAIGFEHSIANWFFIPYGMMLNPDLSVSGAVLNLAISTMGNIVGGTLLVSGV